MMTMELTTRDVAASIGVSERSVQLAFSRNNILPVSKRGKAGLYSIEQLEKLYPQIRQCVGVAKELQTGNTEDGKRKERTDAGKARGKNQELVDYVTRSAMMEFLSDADALVLRGKKWKRKGVRGACYRAVRRLYGMADNGVIPCNATYEDVGAITVQWLYNNWIIRRDRESSSKNTQQFIGAYWKDDWEGEWVKQWREHDSALIGGKVRHIFWKIAEKDFDCGRGDGFGRFVFIDDWVTKVETTDDSGDTGKRTYIVATDVLSGVPLWFEEVDTVTAQGYIRTVLATVLLYGCDRTVWFLENSKAAIADRLENLIRCLYTQEDMTWFNRREHKALFAGQRYIVRNVPSIPNAIGKAFGERMNKELRSISALLFPRAFRGTSRKDSVQLQRSTTPLRTMETLPTREHFGNALKGYAYTEYINRELDSLREWSREKGLPATRESIARYYAPREIKKVDEKRTAMLLYYATLPSEMRKGSLLSRGELLVTIAGREYNLRAAELYGADLVNYSLLVIPLAWKPGFFYVYKKFRDQVWFLCRAEDFTAESAMEAERMRLESRTLREQYAKSRNLDAVRGALELADTRASEAAQAGQELVYGEVKQVLDFVAPASAPEPPAASDEDVIVVSDAQVVVEQIVEQTEEEIEEALRKLGC